MLVIVSPFVDPAINLALEEAVLSTVEESVILIWRNDKCVIVGRNQDTDAEVNMELCRNSGCKVVRRSSGGGAVYQDLGNVNYSYIYRQGWDKKEPTEGEFLMTLIEFIGNYGIEGAFTNRNDIIHDGCKLSGTARAQKGENCLIHGTLLYDADIDFMDRVLTPPEDKLKRNGVKSVKSRVKNIGPFGDFDTEKFMCLLTEYIAKRYCACRRDVEDYLQAADEYRKKKYDNPSWNFGRNSIL